MTMEQFTLHEGIGVPLRISDVDTDQIMPGRYLKRVSRFGFEDGLFANWRKEEDFILNQEPYNRGSVLVAGANFGTGSSREHAVWGLQQYGFKVVIASSFADIFRGNAGKGGLLTAKISQEEVEEIWQALENTPGTHVTVDLPGRSVACNGKTYPFEIDDYVGWRIEKGLDDISLTLRHIDEIHAFEQRRPSWKPVVTEDVA